MNQLDKNKPVAWKWGIIYKNPQHPDLLVEKRNGLGLTFNFGYRNSLWLFLFLIGIGLASIVSLLFI